MADVVGTYPPYVTVKGRKDHEGCCMSTNPAKVSNGTWWPADEVVKLIRLREVDKMSWAKIAKRMQRTTDACAAKYFYERRGGAYRQVAHNTSVVRTIRIPTSVLVERDRAFSAPCSLSSAVLGDPLPGRSALDRMSRQ